MYHAIGYYSGNVLTKDLRFDLLKADGDPVLEAAISEREREWRDGFEAMGRDKDTNSVEYMLPAAWEVLELPT